MLLLMDYPTDLIMFDVLGEHGLSWTEFQPPRARLGFVPDVPTAVVLPMPNHPNVLPGHASD